MSKRKFGLVLVFIFILATSLPAQFKLLRSFAGGPTDGKSPYGSLILSGSTLYGMTFEGGANDSYGTYVGMIFKINMDGTGFALLHSFSYYDGEKPYGSLILIGSTLYGMTSYAGGTYGGTIFKINTDGTGFAVIHSFDTYYSAHDGYHPYGSLISSGSTLYGMTCNGGTIDGYGSDWGTIFKINTNGTGYALLHSFAGSTSDGAYPYGSLIISGSTLYGMTSEGGTSDGGTIFKINADGTGYALLYQFSTATGQGYCPYGSLILSGSTFYGTTCYGGTSDYGTTFKVNTNGSGFARLHSFAGGSSDGAYPQYGSLILSGSTFYGMTKNGGSSDYGVIFSSQFPAADIAVTKSSDNIAPLQGAQFNFTITAKNNGPAGATGIKVTDKLPTGLTFVSQTPSQGGYSSSAGVWGVGLLAKNATATLTLRVKASGSGKVTNTASLGALNEVDSIGSNNSASVAVTIAPPWGSLSVSSGDLYSWGPAGGPFKNTSKVYTLQNIGGASLNWTASKNVGWLTLSSSGGTLAAGASTTVTVQIGSVANSLAAATYSGKTVFAKTGGGSASRNATLVVK